MFHQLTSVVCFWTFLSITFFESIFSVCLLLIIKEEPCTPMSWRTSLTCRTVLEHFLVGIHTLSLTLTRLVPLRPLVICNFLFILCVCVLWQAATSCYPSYVFAFPHAERLRLSLNVNSHSALSLFCARASAETTISCPSNLERPTALESLQFIHHVPEDLRLSSFCIRAFWCFHVVAVIALKTE